MGFNVVWGWDEEAENREREEGEEARESGKEGDNKGEETAAVSAPMVDV